MKTKTRKGTNGHDRGNGKLRSASGHDEPKPKRFTRFAEATGTSWAARFGRGLTRWRERAELSIPVASQKYEIDQTCWYRIEKGNQPATTAKYIDRICLSIGHDVVAILNLGTD